MNRIFIGFDHRQIVSYTALCTSIIEHATEPVAITPLVLGTLPMRRQGLTPFTFSRFLVPMLCGFEDAALFLDVDIIVRDDISKLFEFAYRPPGYAVYVSKNRIKFEWASVMLFNCGHDDNAILTPEYVEKAADLHRIGWTDAIGDLPGEWNHLVGYDPPNPDAKLVHFTQGVPCHPETEGTEFTTDWQRSLALANATQPWVELMGRSVHAKPVIDRLIAEGKIDPASVQMVPAA